MQEDDPFQPATLIIACEGFAALHVQHETGEIIGRINSFLGFNAVGRIKIVQKPVHPEAATAKAAAAAAFSRRGRPHRRCRRGGSRTRACAVRSKGWAARSSARKK